MRIDLPSSASPCSPFNRFLSSSSSLSRFAPSAFHPTVLIPLAVKRLFADLQGQTSLADGLAPARIASTSRSFLMICSAVCCLRFIESLFIRLWLYTHMDQISRSIPQPRAPDDDLARPGQGLGLQAAASVYAHVLSSRRIVFTAMHSRGASGTDATLGGDGKMSTWPKGLRSTSERASMMQNVATEGEV